MARFSGLTEPLGALVALLFLRKLPGDDGAGGGTYDNESPWILKNVLAFVAGIMMAVSICELFPEARRQRDMKNGAVRGGGGGKFTYWTGIACGVFVMVTTEMFLPS